MDEARHVEDFSRYLDEKLSGHYQVNAHLRTLLDDIVADERWDVTYLGMQVLVEGLALAAFGMIRQLADEPLLRELLRRVMTDEARHVAFGVISLSEVYVVPNCAKLGLLDAGDGWLRERFTELDIIGFENVGLADDELAS